MSKMQLFPLQVVGLVLAIALTTAALAQPQDVAHSSTVSSTAHELGREDQMITATVVQVDQQSRFVTLRGPKGKEVTIEAGPEVQNLDQLKPGDQVTTHYQSAVALEILPADSAQAGTEVQGGVATAAKGDKPGGVAGQSVTVTSKLTAVDLKHHTVTLTGADGQQRVIEVKDPARQAQMKKLKVGDMVRITYVEALAITVTPKAKPKG
jgi:Cu/Ag efflux protein CusF